MNTDHHKYTITLTFKAETWGPPVDFDLANQIEKELRNWDEGRYPFDVEMIHHGLDSVIQWAIYQVCKNKADKKYGCEMVQISPTSRASKAMLEASKEHKKIINNFASGRLHLNTDEPRVKIEEAGE
jgi:hypothetical protein